MGADGQVLRVTGEVRGAHQSACRPQLTVDCAGASQLRAPIGTRGASPSEPQTPGGGPVHVRKTIGATGRGGGRPPPRFFYPLQRPVTVLGRPIGATRVLLPAEQHGPAADVLVLVGPDFPALAVRQRTEANASRHGAGG